MRNFEGGTTLIMTETEVQVLTARKDVVSKLLGQKDYRLALEASLDEPPNTSKDQSIKDGTAMCVLQVLNSISDNDILRVIESLSLEDRDTLLKYVYRFMNNHNMSSKLPAEDINCAICLKINAKILELEGLSSIMRVMCDRKTV